MLHLPIRQVYEKMNRIVFISLIVGRNRVKLIPVGKRSRG